MTYPDFLIRPARTAALALFARAEMKFRGTPPYLSPNFSRPRQRSKYMRKSPSSEYHGC